MTVLLSVLAEAYQSRYSTIMQDGLFDKHIRGLKDNTSGSHRNIEAEDERPPTRDPDDVTTGEQTEDLESIRQELSNFPELIVRDARDFQVYVRYVGNPNPGHGDKLPPGLERVLQEAMDQKKMNEAMRKKVLHDEAAKKALVMLHLETTVRRLVDKAERLTVLLTERDALEREQTIGSPAEFDEELVRTDTPVEIRMEESERKIRDEEMGNL